MDPLEEHHRDLLSALIAIRSALDSTLNPRSHPLRYSTFLFTIYRDHPVDPRDTFTCGHTIRQVHDFYGWKAKGRDARGCCAGALYRTDRYTQLPLSVRDGTRNRLRRTIHIEHTVPVASLDRAMSACASELMSPAQLHNSLIKHSVCTAMTVGEELSVRTLLGRKLHTCFDEMGNPVHDKPFERYVAIAESDTGFAVRNIMTGEVIDLKAYTFEDHERALLEASERVRPDGPSIYKLVG